MTQQRHDKLCAMIRALPTVRNDYVRKQMLELIFVMLKEEVKE